MQKFALIVAGGKGVRMGTDLPKQFLLLNNEPVLMHTIRAFSEIPDTNIVLVLPEHHFDYWKSLCVQYNFGINHQLVEGGASRFESVRNGLNSITNDNGLVAIHDGVRPLVSRELIDKGFDFAAFKGNALAVVALKESLRKQELLENHAVDRSNYYLVQTPQTFKIKEIREAYNNASHENFTDDAGVYESNGGKIQMIEGDYKNIKITTPEDLVIAEALIKLIEG